MCKRSMWKKGSEKIIGYAPKLLEALEKQIADATIIGATHGGRWNKQGLPLRTSKGTQLSTGQSRPNLCGETTQYHQQAPAPHPNITYEVAGNTTSKIPSNKNGITIDTQVQMNGAKKPQELVTEQNTVLISATAIKGDSKATAYLQRDDRTEAVLKAMASDSSIK